jgi:hypothetical protein
MECHPSVGRVGRADLTHTIDNLRRGRHPNIGGNQSFLEAGPKILINGSPAEESLQTASERLSSLLEAIGERSLLAPGVRQRPFFRRGKGRPAPDYDDRYRHAERD